MSTAAGASAAGIEFPVVKLLDYAPQYEELEADPNPFAVVVLAHLKALETRRSPAERHAWKVRLVKGLYERGMDPEDVRRLFRFIDWVLELPEPLEQLFWDEIAAYQQEKRMPFIEHRGSDGHGAGVAPGHRGRPEDEVRRRGPGADAGTP